MSELTALTDGESLGLTELPEGVTVQEAVIVAGALNGLVHDELERVYQRSHGTNTERDACLAAFSRVCTIWNYAVKVTELAMAASSSSAELSDMVVEAGLLDDPRITVDFTHPYWFVRPAKEA